MNNDMHFKDLRDLLETSERLYSNEIAFKTKKKGAIEEVTYAKFAKDVRSLASYLLSLNMKNKRVAVISANRYEWCMSYFATLTSDLTIVPLDKSLPEAEFHSLIERSQADVIIYEDKYTDYIANEKDNEKKQQSNREYQSPFLRANGEDKVRVLGSQQVALGAGALE